MAPDEVADSLQELIFPFVLDQMAAVRNGHELGAGDSASNFFRDRQWGAEVFIDAIRPMLTHSLLTQPDSADDATTALYLCYRRGGQIPARMGYLIGYEIARRTAATRR